MLRLASCAAALFVLAACGGGEPAAPATAPPVIVVQPPADTADVVEPVTAAATDYAGQAWEEAAGAAAANANGEPDEVVALLREFEAELTDPAGDGGASGWDDLLSAFVVMDARYLYGRILTQAPMSIERDEVREIRFWLEQDGKMVTIEVKVGTGGAPCELLPATGGEAAAKVVEGCWWIGNAIDIRIPLDSIPTIDVSQPYWASGFQTCCQDAERARPFDDLEAAQEVWRVPGLAVEKESADDKPYTPGKATEGEAVNVP